MTSTLPRLLVYFDFRRKAASDPQRCGAASKVKSGTHSDASVLETNSLCVDPRIKANRAWSLFGPPSYSLIYLRRSFGSGRSFAPRDRFGGSGRYHVVLFESGPGPLQLVTPSLPLSPALPVSLHNKKCPAEVKQ